jgi:catechol 2,3-dioxygenase-like lactoylglutathione lyase family enzyme
MIARQYWLMSIASLSLPLLHAGCSDSSDSAEKGSADAGTAFKTDSSDSAEKDAVDAGTAFKTDSAPDAQAQYLGPYLQAAGIGVSDLEKSKDFYTRVVGMRMKSAYKLDNGDEVVLEFKDGKGSNLVLTHYTDDIERNYKNNPDKIVFYVTDAAQFAQGFKNEGLKIEREPSVYEGTTSIVGMARDPDGYLVEIVQDTSTAIPYLGAGGIGVTDLTVSTEFYTSIIGMSIKYSLPVPGLMNENIMEFKGGKGSGVVLMYFTDGVTRNYKDLPYKLLFNVPTASEFADKLRNAGMTILSEPTVTANRGNAVIGLAKDPDGYLIEFIESAN